MGQVAPNRSAMTAEKLEQPLTCSNQSIEKNTERTIFHICNKNEFEYLMLRIYRKSILCLQPSGNIHPSVPKHLHLHALSDKIMKQKSPVGSCGKRFSSFPSRNFNSWVQTLSGPNTSHLQKKVLINMHGPIVFVQSNPNQTPQDFTLSLQQRLSAASMLVIPEHCPCGKERNQQSAGTAPVGSTPTRGMCGERVKNGQPFILIPEVQVDQKRRTP